MEAARPRTRGRRLRRGTVERPLNARLVRVGFLVVAPAILAFLFSISTTAALPRFPLAPLFDAESAASFSESLTTVYPSRVPGSEGAAEAARWYRETVGALGLETEEDVWTEDLADLGSVELRNVTTVVPGRSDETIVLVAHRDNAGTEQRLGENAAGTAILIELARGFAPQEVGPDPRLQHTLVLASTDAGAFGGAGAARLAAKSPLAQGAIAVVVLDDLTRGRPRLAIAGDDPVSPARTLVRTAADRVSEEVGVSPALPSVASQLVDLGIPFALDEQGRFLAAGLSAVTLTTDSDGETTAAPATDRLGQLGRATEALVGSLDTSVGGAFRTPDSIFFSDRAASGWTARLVLILGVVPFALGVVDLIVRGRRRALPFRPALRAQRSRLGVWAFGGFIVAIGAIGGILPSGAPLPLAPYSASFEQRPVFGIVVLLSLFVLGWLVARRHLVPAAPATPDERLAGFVVALTTLAIAAIGLAVLQPYALVFVLPSLYAWLWLPLDGRPAIRAVVFATGLLGPILGLLLLGHELGLSVLDTMLYVISLFTVGYLPLSSALLGIVWVAAATQVGALSLARYAPYAAGREPPPAGPIRRLVTRSR
ncbi:MAG TPA: M28 family peptidase [Gaiellaceae bacterium]